jgi:Family of unknown function (DUF5722)
MREMNSFPRSIISRSVFSHSVFYRLILVLIFTLIFSLNGLRELSAEAEKTVSQEDKTSIEKVSVTDQEIVIHINGKNQHELQLLELAAYEEFQIGNKYSVAWTGKASDQLQLSIPRIENQRDRLYSHWQLVDIKTGKPSGASQYASDFQKLSSSKTKFHWNKDSIKGLQCIVDFDDAIDLKVKHSTQNLYISQVVDVTGKSKHFHTVDGVKVPININFVRGLDPIIKKMTDAGMNVIIILLNPIPTKPDPGNPLIHPDSNLKEAPNHLGAFNLTDKKGVLYYRAALEFLAERYSRPDAKYGLISSYIIGNELQSHWWWHNMGDAKPEKIIREYALALRLAYYAARKQHNEIRVYASMDHHWTATIIPNRLRAIPGKILLDHLNKTILNQGNFNWSLAHHPYPENLFEPRTWNDKQVTFNFNTPKITFKNLEVLTAYFSQSQFMINGKRRKIILSEQGFHKPDGPDGEIIQAAAYAYAYYRTMQFPEIDAFIYHRHIDHAREGGLRLGIREFRKGTITTPGKKRFLYNIYHDLNSDNWETVFEFAKPIIGIQNWKELNPVKVNANPEK